MHAISSALGRSLTPTRAALTGVAFAVIFGVIANVASAAKRVEIVTQGAPPATHQPYVSYYSTIQAAVNASKRGTYILVEPGTYDEAVKITKHHSGIFLRGMNRNEVILDGQHEVVPGGRNGIEIYKANNVWVENLTVRNFDREEEEGANGNEIWWNGGAESGRVHAHGWYGKYLTAYDTGLNGGYGIFTSNSTEGEWENIYASGFNDSGIYIGACAECKAKVNHATMEYNALGYSGSNSGGELIIENSIFRHNTTGIAPNGENPGDGPPPENGQCQAEREADHNMPLKRGKVKERNEHGEIEHVERWVGPLPKFTTAHVERCEIFRDNLIAENNDLTAPANHSAAAAPWGAGIELPGDYGDLVEGNEIIDNPSDGVLGFEYPNPYNPPSFRGSIFFQNAGNEVANNKFEGNGYLGGAYAGSIAFEGGQFGEKTSTDNCFTGNTYGADQPTFPANIEGTWGCQNSTTPNPNEELGFIEYLLALQEESVHRPPSEPVGEPPPQTTDPKPCEGVPANPTCEKYESEH